MKRFSDIITSAGFRWFMQFENGGLSGGLTGVLIGVLTCGRATARPYIKIVIGN
jgi:hypothetical protein